MKKFTFSFKSLLLAAGLLLGSANAWGGDVTTLYGRAVSADLEHGYTAWSASDIGTGNWTGDTEQASITANGLNIAQTTNGSRSISYSSISPTAYSILTYDIVWDNGSSYQDNGNYTYLRVGSGIEFRAYSQAQKGELVIGESVINIPNACKKNQNRDGDVWTIHMEINTLSGNVTALTIAGNKGTTKVNYTLSSATSYGAATFTSLTLGWYRAKQGPDWTTTLKSIRIQEEPQSAPIADYTVKYVSTISAVETEIKSNVSRKGAVDATVTLGASDKNTITYSGHQYYYVSDNASASTIANDNSTVVKVVFAQATFDNGDYYFKNKSNGAYFAAGNNWGTHAVSNMQGHVTALTVQPGGKYHIDTHISNGGDNHYLNGEYTDGAAQEWAIASDGAGYYTINNGSGNLTAGAVGENLTVGASTGDNAKWTILTTAEWKADQEARLAGATAASGEDATFYIAAPNFPRNDNAENAKWLGGPTIAGYEGDNGNGINYNGQKFTDPYATFDVYQALTGVKPGAYKLTAQGFYRNGLNNASDANDNLAKLYANSSEVALKNIRCYGYTDDSHSAEGFTTDKSGIFVPDNQSDAGLAFNANKFENELYVVVGEDGNLRVGVKKDAATGPNQDWAVFDNFKLTYYGNTVSATIGTTGYTTFASPYALDLSGMTASTGTVTAFVASAQDGTNVTLNVAPDDVQAGEGLVLKGTAGATITIPVIASSANDPDNLLVGCPTATEITAEMVATTTKYYVIANNGGKAQFQYLNAAITIPAGKAYLPVTTGGVKALNIVVPDGTATGVDAPAVAEAEEDGVLYNTSGQQVTKDYKGIVIVNGKKFYNK